MGFYPKGAKGKCDKIFSKIIRARGACERCGNRENLQTAHIISRRYAATRTEELNAWSLCAGCHLRLTNWPREHSDFITETIGLATYEKLRARAETVSKVDWEAEYIRLKKIAKERNISL